MKLTWFGGGALRVHIGGQIAVFDPADAVGYDFDEIVSGAERVVRRAEGVADVDAQRWHPRRVSPLDLPAEPVLIGSLGEGSRLVDAVGEPPLVLLHGASGVAGRWARDAVVVAFSAQSASSALEAMAPRLVALALDGDGVERAIADLAPRLGGTGLVALERGLALEV